MKSFSPADVDLRDLVLVPLARIPGMSQSYIQQLGRAWDSNWPCGHGEGTGQDLAPALRPNKTAVANPSRPVR